MNTDRPEAENQNKAKITKLATGVDFIASTNGQAMRTHSDNDPRFMAPHSSRTPPPPLVITLYG